LDPPILVHPIKKKVIKTHTNQEEVAFEWNQVPQSTKYRVVVEKRNKDRKLASLPVIDKVVEETTDKSLPLPDGVYSWKVFGIDEKGKQGEPSEVWQFQVLYKKLISAPRLMEPLVK
jgi:hypothetical protein